MRGSAECWVLSGHCGYSGVCMGKRPSSRWCALLCAAAAVGVLGCGQPAARPLRPEAFLGRRDGVTNARVQPVDQPGALTFDDAPAEPAAPPERPNGPDPVRQGFSPTVREAVRSPVENGTGAVATTAPAPPAATNPAAAPQTTGGFQLVGTVLAEVNGTPIFADRVLAAIDKELAAQAKRLDEGQFQAFAARAIKDQVDKSVYDELEFAMAQRRLDPRDAELARMATTRWKQEQITKAGGSPEVARQRAAAAGYNFDELADEQYRLFMRRLYYERKELPKIQVSATDIRRYYQENAQREFTTPDRARFRVIKVDKRNGGGRDEALAKVRALRERVTSGGKDFAELAAEDNDEEGFKKPVDWFLRNSFAVKEVEDAVWQLKPGQVTDVIETPDAFYIARLEALEHGRVRGFEEPDVQRDIEKTLKDRQFTAMRLQRQKELIEEDRTIRYHPQMLQVAVEMAMQKYRYWQTAAR